jgi:hypothetical protein
MTVLDSELTPRDPCFTQFCILDSYLSIYGDVFELIGFQPVHASHFVERRDLHSTTTPILRTKSSRLFAHIELKPINEISLSTQTSDESF